MNNKKPPTDTGDDPSDAPERWEATIGPGDTGYVSYTPMLKGGGNAYHFSVPNTVQKPRSTRGTPIVKDWQAAFRWLVAKVGKEGFPTGHGSQAKVECWIADWFERRKLEIGESTVREQARLILQEFEKINKGR